MVILDRQSYSASEDEWSYSTGGAEPVKPKSFFAFNLFEEEENILSNSEDSFSVSTATYESSSCSSSSSSDSQDTDGTRYYEGDGIRSRGCFWNLNGFNCEDYNEESMVHNRDIKLDAIENFVASQEEFDGESVRDNPVTSASQTNMVTRHYSQKQSIQQRDQRVDDDEEISLYSYLFGGSGTPYSEPTATSTVAAASANAGAIAPTASRTPTRSVTARESRKTHSEKKKRGWKLFQKKEKELKSRRGRETAPNLSNQRTMDKGLKSSRLKDQTSKATSKRSNYVKPANIFAEVAALEGTDYRDDVEALSSRGPKSTARKSSDRKNSNVTPSSKYAEKASGQKATRAIAEATVNEAPPMCFPSFNKRGDDNMSYAENFRKSSTNSRMYNKEEMSRRHQTSNQARGKSRSRRDIVPPMDSRKAKSRSTTGSDGVASTSRNSTQVDKVRSKSLSRKASELEKAPVTSRNTIPRTPSLPNRKRSGETTKSRHDASKSVSGRSSRSTSKSRFPKDPYENVYKRIELDRQKSMKSLRSSTKSVKSVKSVKSTRSTKSSSHVPPIKCLPLPRTSKYDDIPYGVLPSIAKDRAIAERNHLSMEKSVAMSRARSQAKSVSHQYPRQAANYRDDDSAYSASSGWFTLDSLDA